MASSGGEAAASWQPPPKQGLYDPNLERKDDIYQHVLFLREPFKTTIHLDTHVFP